MKQTPLIMGILNVTPDSFSDGGKFFAPKKAIAHALRMIQEGADIIDVGGESSGPGSTDVPVQEELRRVIPVILSLRGPLTSALVRGMKQSKPDCFASLRSARNDIVVSIDTYKAEVARRAIASGARMVNDVTALRGDRDLARVIAKSGAQIVLMYSKDPTARTTRKKKHYRDVVKTIMEFLEQRIRYALASGIKKNQIIIDPGMGAFVSGIPKYSYEILRRLGEFKKLGFPILVGTSRKSFLPGLIDERLIPTIISNLVALKNGADIIRVHDVAEHTKFFKALN